MVIHYPNHGKGVHVDWTDYIGKVTQGDCLELMKNIPDKSIDLVLTDPPYGIGYQSNMRVVSKQFDRIENDNNDSRFTAYKEYSRILRENSACIVFCSFKNYAYDYMELSKCFDIKNAIIWSKGGGGIGDLTHSLLTDYEIAIVCHKGQCNIRGKRDGSVWHSNKVNPNEMVHPTEKPIDLLARIIDKFSDKENLVLDTYCGSGSTLVASEKLGRKWIGFEIRPEYCEIAQARIDKERNQLKLSL